jgi:hypothetical protein
MPETLQPGPHLSPDQLSALAENVLPEHERLTMLSHLSVCADCRQVVFLAQHADPSHAAPAPATPRRGWFPLPQIFIAASGALACTLILALIVHLHHDQNPSTPAVTTAQLQPLQPTIPPPLAPPTLTSAPQKPVGTPPPAAPAQLSPAAAHSLAEAPSSAAPPPKLLPKVELRQLTPGTPAHASVTADIGSASTRAQESQMEAKAYFDTESNAAANTFAAAAPKSPPAVAAAGPVYSLPPPPPPPAAPATANKSMRQSSSAATTALARKDFPAENTTVDAASEQTLSTLQTANGVASTINQVSVENLPGAGRASQSMLAPPIKLPGKKPVVAQLVATGRILALDTAGTLFITYDSGKRWTAVAPQWSGKAVQLSFAPSPARLYLNQPQSNQTQIPSNQSNGYIINGSQNAAPQQQTQQTLTPTVGFQLTTATGVVWLSTDGLTWHPR